MSSTATEKKPVTYRDMTVPYSEDEIEEVRKAMKAMPTYNPDYGGTVSVVKTSEVLEAMRFERNPQQIKAYEDYWITYFNGQIDFNALYNIMKNLHKNDTYLGSVAQNCDKDRDGLITREEFADLLNLMTIHDPELAKFKPTFEKFEAEVDLNKDGKVSVGECGNWLVKKTSSV